MKDKTIAAILALFLGGLGVHKFYLGKYLSGILYLVFSWTFIPTILGFISGISYLLTSEESFDRKYNGLDYPQQHSLNEMPRRNKVDVADEILKLNDLREKGIISDDEFLYRKEIILES